MTTNQQNPGRTWLSLILWILAVIIMFLAADFQERTGPTKDFTGSFQVAGVEYPFALVRSGNTDARAPVVVPDPGDRTTGRLMFKRYPTDDPFSPLPMESVGGDLQALLPIQPAAGKLEYYVVVETPEGRVRIPDQDTLILRYKDPVPLGFLVPHVLFMFIALLVGVRTALGAMIYPEGLRRLAWTTLGLMTVGGMILGPIVQKYAFGSFWTGWPLGYDLTDNKTLIMWLVWVVVALVLRKRPAPRGWAGRVAILLAATVMMAVYLIPHSLRGSEFDYSELDEVSAGPSPAEVPLMEPLLVAPDPAQAASVELASVEVPLVAPPQFQEVF